MKMGTGIHRNAFYVLGASVRDSKKRIVELAGEKALEIDHDICQKARSDITNPRARISSELSWFPGVSPAKAIQLISILDTRPMDARKEVNIPALSKANLMAAALESLKEVTDSDFAEFIKELAHVAADILPEEVTRHINEDRIASGFPEVTSVDHIEAEIAERKRFYRSSVKGALDLLAADRLVAIITRVVSESTEGGTQHAPELIDDLVDSYEVDARGFLERESESLIRLIAAARESAPKGRAVILPLVDKIESVARNWDRVAQPIQVSAMARGIRHKQSNDVAHQIRELGVDLFNKHDMLDIAHRFTSLNEELFSELPEFSEITKKDSATLNEIINRKRFEEKLAPIHRLCRSCSEATEINPESGVAEANKVLREGSNILAGLRSMSLPDGIISEARDEIALSAMHCVVGFGNKTSKWRQCTPVLDACLKMVSTASARERITKNLKTVKENEGVFGDLEPISSAPSLSTINGIGFTLYGSTDHDVATGSYVSTYYFVFFAIPIFPIKRYRVIPTPGGYRFLGAAPLRTFDKWHIAVTLGLFAWMFFAS